MKHIKPYQIFENNQQPQHPGFPETEEEIHRLCKKYKIENYTINDDLSIDVDGNVNFSMRGIRYLPLNFNYVSGYFYCQDNKLETLKGSPHTVGGNYYCSFNNLTSLGGAPHTVGGYFDCSFNNLTSLEGAPHTVGGYFDCHNNNIMSLEYLPKGINYTDDYTSFEENPIYTLIYTFIENDNSEDLVQEFNDYDIVRGVKVVLDRLKTFISDFDLEMPNLDEVRKYYEIV